MSAPISPPEEESATLQELDRALVETLEPQRVLELVCKAAGRLVDARGTAVAGLETGSTHLFGVVAGQGELAASVGRNFPVRGSLSGIAVESLTPVLENRVVESSAAAHAASLPGARIQRAIVVPLLCREAGVLGTLSCTRHQEDPPFSPAHVGLMEALARRAAVAIRYSRAYEGEQRRAGDMEALREELARRVRQLEALHHTGVEICAAVCGGGEQDRLLEGVLDGARTITGARYAALGVMAPDGRRLERFITRGLSPEEKSLLDGHPSDRGLMGAVVREGVSIRLESSSRDPRSVGTPDHRPGSGPSLGVPIALGSRVFGNLYLLKDPDESPFSEADERVVEMLAAQAGVALENARLMARGDALVRQLEEARRNRNRLQAYVSHDLRNALHGVALWAERLGRVREGEASPPWEVTAGIAQKIRRGADHALRLVTDVLDLARLEEGHLRTSPRLVRSEELMEAAVDAVRLEAEKKGIRFAVSGPPAPVELWADPDRVLQVVTNLLSNAVKFSPRDSVVELASADTSTAQGRRLAIGVRDRGPGIHPKDLDRVFGPYQQLPERDAGTGSGLGLALSRALAKQMGGSLEVDSAPGQGSTFTLLLPHRPPQTKPSNKTQDPASRGQWVG